MPPSDLSVTEIAESAQRGRPFVPIRERELNPVLRDLAGRLPGAKNGLLLAPEFRGARGVVDLLAVTRFQPAFAGRIAQGQPFFVREFDTSLLARLSPHFTRTTDYLAELLGTSPRQVETRLRALVRSGAAERVGRGFRRTKGLEPGGRAYALEAKVQDWRKGLAQALRYASWADAAGVVLLERPGDLSEVAERFRALRIGLAVGRSWIVRPVISKPNPGRRFALSEQLAAQVWQELHTTARNQSPSASA